VLSTVLSKKATQASVNNDGHGKGPEFLSSSSSSRFFFFFSTLLAAAYPAVWLSISAQSSGSNLRQRDARVCDGSHSQTIQRATVIGEASVTKASLSLLKLPDESNLSVKSTRPGNEGAVGGQLMQGRLAFPLACHMPG
jgi:hypothetical protein